jgi:hypothetical protein
VGGGIIAARRKADEMLVAPPVGNLDDAEPVAAGVQTHRLGIDGDRPGREHAWRKVFLMKMDGHEARIGVTA